MLENIVRDKKALISLAVILILSFLVRMLSIAHFVRMDNSEVASKLLKEDGPCYDGYALNILNNGVFNIRDEHDCRYPPGYPLFLAFIYRIFDYSKKAVVIIQGIIDIATVFLVYLLAKEIFKSHNLALTSSLLYMINSSYAKWYLTLYPETLFTLILCIAFFIFFIGLRKNRIRLLALSGFTFGLSVFTKPAYLFLVIMLAPAILIRHGMLKNKIKQAVIIVIMFLIPVFIWQMRNLYRYGYFGLSTGRGHYLYTCCVAKAVSYSKGISFDEARERVKNPLMGKYENPFEKSKVQDKLVWEYIVKNPKTYFYVTIIGIRDFFFIQGLKFSWHLLEECLEYLCLFLGAVFILRKKNEDDSKLYTLFVISLLIAVALGASACGMYRYRSPQLALYLPISVKGIFEICRLVFYSEPKSAIRKKVHHPEL